MKPMTRPRRAGRDQQKTEKVGRDYLLINAQYLAYSIVPILWSGAER